MGKRIAFRERRAPGQIPDGGDFVYNPAFEGPFAEQNFFGRDAERVVVPKWEGGYPPCESDPLRRPSRVLTRREEKILFLRYNYARYRMSLAAGDPRERFLWSQRMEEIRSDLVTANLGLVLHMAKKRPSSILCFEERVSEGCALLFRCIRRFDPLRAKFSTYFCRAFYSHITQAERRVSRPGHPVDGQILAHLVEAASQDGPRDISWILREILRGEISCGILPLQRLILWKHYLEGKTYKEIGKLLGLDKENTRQWARKALVAIREFLERHPEFF